MTTTTVDKRPSLLDRPLLVPLAAWDWEKTIYLLLIVGAFVTRFYDLGARVMSHDESLHTQYAWYLYEGRGFQHSPLMHGPLRFEATALVYWVLGDNDYTSRVPAAIMGVLAVGLIYFFRKWLGRAGALLASGMILISPFMLYYSRYIRDEPFCIVWGLLMALCVIRYMESREAKFLYGLAAVTALFYATMEISFIYIAITMLFLGLHVVRELFAVEWPQAEYRQPFVIASIVTILAIAIGVGLFFYNQKAGVVNSVETAVPANPGAILPFEQMASASPYLKIAFVAGIIAVVGLLAGVFLVFRSFGQEMRRFPVMDLLMVFGLFVLAQLTAFPVRALGKNPTSYTLPTTQGMPLGQALSTFFSSDAGITVTVAVLLLAISALVGWWWDFKKFLICAGIFYGIFIPLFTTFFTNGAGLATGLIGGLGYWLEQQGVHRGGQPWFYYLLINLPIYEFLPLLGTLFTGGFALALWLRGETSKSEEARKSISPSDTLGFPVIGYFGFWGVMMLIGLMIAGEKMPWLTTHITLPLILVTGWGVGQVIERTDWGHFRERRAWLVAVLLPVTIVAAVSAIGLLLGSNPPFQGSELPKLEATGAFVSALVVAVLGGLGVYRFGSELGWFNVVRLTGLWFFALLALLTARAAFIASYVRYDSAEEFLVYAHGARGIKTVMEQIDDISERTTDGKGMRVAYDNQFSWPGTWYLRDYTNQSYYAAQPTREALDAPVVIAGSDHWASVERILGDRYYQFEYIRMVWPMQDYFNVTWDGVKEAFTNAQRRQAIWDIWFDRNYKRYGELTNQNFDVSKWVVNERMRFYVRKDIAAEIWTYGVGPAKLSENTTTEDPYLKGKRTVSALTTFGSFGSATGLFNAPRGIGVGRDGSVYVADSRNHRIQKFDADGKPLLSWGAFGSTDQGTGDPGKFNEPWGVAVGPDGSVYVADTWNHRIQKFDANGTFVKTWGHWAQDGALDSFYGPRAVAVDAAGLVYVADTGNKRVVVFDQDGNGKAIIGSPGSDPGLLDEPVGVAAGTDGTVYVVDTWNQRIQTFKPDTTHTTYSFAQEWSVDAWYGQSLENKPYLAVDGEGRLYMTDPEGYRILVFSKDGQFIATWGDYGSDNNTFNLPNGIAIDSTGNIYVADGGAADGGNHRVMKFPPLTP